MATPIELDELGRVTPDRYTLRNVRRRLSNKADPWASIGRYAVSASAMRDRMDARGVLA